MNYDQIISDIESQLCTSCRVGRTLALLRELCIHADPQLGSSVDPTPTEPTKPKQIRSKPNKTELPKGQKACKKCGVTKPLDAFPLSKNCSDGRLGSCKACIAEAARKSYQARQQGKAPAKPFTCKCGKGFATKLVFEDHCKKCERSECLSKPMPDTSR